MRKNHGILVVPEQVIRKVRDITTITFVEKGFESFGIDQFASRKVEKDGTGLEMGNDIWSNNTMSTILSFNVWNVDGNVVGTRDCGSNRISECQVSRQLQSRLDRKTGIVSCHKGKDSSIIEQDIDE